MLQERGEQPAFALITQEKLEAATSSSHSVQQPRDIVAQIDWRLAKTVCTPYCTHYTRPGGAREARTRGELPERQPGTWPASPGHGPALHAAGCAVRVAGAATEAGPAGLAACLAAPAQHH